MARLGAAFVPAAPRRDRFQRGPWPVPLPAWFWGWAAWVDHGRPPGQRPPSAPARVPAWAWARYAAHKKRPPAPAPSPPSPPPHGRFQIYERPILCAEEPLTVINTPPSYPVWLSADPAYRAGAAAAVQAFRQQQRPIGAWCNPTEVSPSALRDFARDFGIDDRMLMGQAESELEFTTSLAAGLPVVVGNLSALSDVSRAAVADHRIGFVQEDYWNVMPWLVPNWYGLPVICSCAGLYYGEGPYGRYVPRHDYEATDRWLNGRDGFYHAAGPQEASHPEDYLGLRASP